MAEPKESKKAEGSAETPLIVKSRPILPDPDDQPTDKPAEAKTPSGPKIVTPLNKPPEDKKAPEPPTAQSSDVAPSNPPAASEESSEAVVDAVAGQAKDKKKEEEEAKAEADKRAQIEQLVTDKKYFVPLGVTHRQKTHRLTLVAVIVVVVVALAAVVAYQTGVIEI